MGDFLQPLPFPISGIFPRSRTERLRLPDLHSTPFPSPLEPLAGWEAWNLARVSLVVTVWLPGPLEPSFLAGSLASGEDVCTRVFAPPSSSPTPTTPTYPEPAMSSPRTSPSGTLLRREARPSGPTFPRVWECSPQIQDQAGRSGRMLRRNKLFIHKDFLSIHNLTTVHKKSSSGDY